MKLFNLCIIEKLLLALLLAVLISPGLKASEAASSSLGNVVIPQPALPENARQCVEPVDIMRRNHMKFLQHQRDDTVHRGIRTKKYSLTGCIDCHALKAESGQFVRAEEPEHFCTTCHKYTAVNIDCFECHSDRPSAAADRVSNNSSTNELLIPTDSSLTFNMAWLRRYNLQLQQVEISHD